MYDKEKKSRTIRKSVNSLGRARQRPSRILIPPVLDPLRPRRWYRQVTALNARNTGVRVVSLVEVCIPSHACTDVHAFIPTSYIHVKLRHPSTDCRADTAHRRFFALSRVIGGHVGRYPLALGTVVGLGFAQKRRGEGSEYDRIRIQLAGSMSPEGGLLEKSTYIIKHRAVGGISDVFDHHSRLRRARPVCFLAHLIYHHHSLG